MKKEMEELEPLEQEEGAPEEAELLEKPLQYVRVNPGDTVESIAAEYETTVEKIIEDNKINPDWLFVGHWLYV